MYTCLFTVLFCKFTAMPKNNPIYSVSEFLSYIFLLISFAIAILIFIILVAQPSSVHVYDEKKTQIYNQNLQYTLPYITVNATPNGPVFCHTNKACQTYFNNRNYLCIDNNCVKKNSNNPCGSDMDCVLKENSCAIGKCIAGYCVYLQEVDGKSCTIDESFLPPKDSSAYISLGAKTTAQHLGVCSQSGCDAYCSNPNYGDCNANVTDGCETYLMNNLTNCGSCGTVCYHPYQTLQTACQSGSCLITMCYPGYSKCDGNFKSGCECGPSPEKRVLSAGCYNGVCRISGCFPGYQDCDGDFTNGCECGPSVGPYAFACGANKQCIPVCSQQGFATCPPNSNNPADFCTTNILSDPNNCGGCGNNQCYQLQTNATLQAINNIVGAQCSGGSCSVTCPPDAITCQNPLMCNCFSNLLLNQYSYQAVCNQKQCSYSCVNSNYKNCNNNLNDGCETNILTDPNNCGSCGYSCAQQYPNAQNVQSFTCNNGQCQAVCYTYYTFVSLSQGCIFNSG